MILIVDDNQENIFSLKTLLELHKFVVDSATSGEEALRRVLKNSYSLIILDVQMPDMDGFEVAEAISGYSKSREIPIIFLSAINTHKKYVAKGYAAGGVDYVTKPFDVDILLLKIKTFYRLSEQKRRLIEMDKSLRAEIEFRKKAETDLEQKVEELRSTLESMPHMAFTTCQDGKIEFVNNHWLTYSASTTDFPETDGVTVMECMQKAIASRKQLIQEVNIKLLGGAEYRFHVLYLTPVMSGDNAIRWVGIFTDIHEQKTASHMLERKVEERTKELRDINRKLENSNRELKKFAFITSHDLQEPLRKIQVFADMIVEKFAGDWNNTERFLKKIITSADRMRRLITSLLEYSRLPENDHFEQADMNVIIANVMQDFELAIKAKKAKIHIDKIPPFEVIPCQIRQVFHNLLSNALKFTRAGIPPEINIKAELVSEKSIDAEVDAQGRYCRITFSDNGIGFEEMYTEKVFEIFQRLNQREDYEGTGIGLAIVKKVLDRHEGIIKATSQVDKGTTFVMVLPVNQH